MSYIPDLLLHSKQVESTEHRLQLRVKWPPKFLLCVLNKEWITYDWFKGLVKAGSNDHINLFYLGQIKNR